MVRKAKGWDLPGLKVAYLWVLPFSVGLINACYPSTWSEYLNVPSPVITAHHPPTIPKVVRASSRLLILIDSMLNSFTFSQLGGALSSSLAGIFNQIGMTLQVYRPTTAKWNELRDNSKLIFALQCSNLTVRSEKEEQNFTSQQRNEADGSRLYIVSFGPNLICLSISTLQISPLNQFRLANNICAGNENFFNASLNRSNARNVPQPPNNFSPGKPG